jgi:hypothetical protein
MESFVIITKEFIHAGRTENNGWTKDQLRLLGLNLSTWWPKNRLIRGWQQVLINKKISARNAVEFLELGAEPGAFQVQFNSDPPPQYKSRVAQMFAEGKSFSEVESEIKYPD